MEISGAERIQRFIKEGKEIVLVSDIHTDFRDKTKRNPLYLPKFIDNLITSDSKNLGSILNKCVNNSSKPDLPFLKLLNTYFLEDEFTNPEKQEKSYYKNFLKNGGTLLALTKSYFGSKGCFMRSKRCSIPNARFHFIDIRQRNIGSCIFSNVMPFTKFSNELFIHLYPVKDSWNKEELLNILVKFKDEILGAIEDLIDCKSGFKKNRSTNIYKKGKNLSTSL